MSPGRSTVRSPRTGAAADVIGHGHWGPWIHADCRGPQEIITTGVSLGAFHAVNVPDAAHDWSSWRRQLAHHLPRFC